MDMEGLSVICASLGILEEDEMTKQKVYVKGEHCLDSLKDLLRFLRRDDPETREVFKQVCRWNIASKNLIPIIEHWQHDRNLVLNAVKVLVFLSMPIEPSSSDIPQQMEYLWNLKFSLASSDAVVVIVSLLEGPLENLECELFTEDDWKLVQLVLTLFRNILAIQDISSLQKAGQFLSLRDRFLELLFRENVMELIIVITQQIGGSRGYLRQDNLLLLETFHYIFMGQDPELLVKAHLMRSEEGGEAKACIDDLKAIMEEEAKKKRVSSLQCTNRHSQFSGTFTRHTMGGSTVVYMGKPKNASQNALFKSHNGHGTQKIVRGHVPLMRKNVLTLLHDFVNQFLSGGYNVLMKSVREDIEKEQHTVQKGDIIVFFKVAEFVTSFQYHKCLTSKPSAGNGTSEASADKFADSSFSHGEICGPIAASMNESMFQLVISRWRDAFEGLKETNDYKFLSAASSLLKNMIRVFDLVLNLFPEDSKEPQTARILLYKLFYDQTDQGMTQFILNQIKMFNSRKQTKSDLADLVEMMHIIMQLMEKLQARGSLRVSKKSRKAKKKKKAVSDNITKSEQFEAQAVVPDTDGSSICEHPAEFLAEQESPLKWTSDLKEYIKTSHLVDELRTSETKMGSPEDPPRLDNDTPGHADDDLCCSTDDSSGDEQAAPVNEVDFNVSTLVSAFANCSFIQNICWLLKFYRSNSSDTNQYIIGLLRKITDDLELAPMLYQLSLLTTFYDILQEQKLSPSEEDADIVGFVTSLVRKMLKKMKHQPLLFIEILFWKTRRECHYINAEYLLHELGSWKKGNKNQDSIPGTREVGSSEPGEWVHRSLADALGEDEADVVISHDVGHQNEENSLENESAKINERRRLVLSDDMETKLKDLYEKFKDDPNCSHLIAESLDPSGGILPAQVSNKLKKLGLKVAPKKRIRNGGRSFIGTSDQQGDGSTLNDSNNLEGSPQRQPLNTNKRVSAFNEDQEAIIKDLFEQFKDHRRCSYMIANALDADNTFTAAQVSRKLKQLGLHVPKKKKSKDNMHLKDEELNDLSANEMHDSDNETLLSLRKRKKDNEGLFNQDFPRQNLESKLSENTYDETLSSVLKKSRKLPLKSKNEKLPTVTDMEENDKISGNVGANDVTESNELTEMDATFHHDIKECTSEAVKLSHISPENAEIELAHHEVEDDLADSGDEAVFDSFVESTIGRRNRRMVIDPEDDD